MPAQAASGLATQAADKAKSAESTEVVSPDWRITVGAAASAQIVSAPAPRVTISLPPGLRVTHPSAAPAPAPALPSQPARAAVETPVETHGEQDQVASQAAQKDDSLKRPVRAKPRPRAEVDKLSYSYLAQNLPLLRRLRQHLKTLPGGFAKTEESQVTELTPEAQEMDRRLARREQANQADREYFKAIDWRTHDGFYAMHPELRWEIFIKNIPPLPAFSNCF